MDANNLLHLFHHIHHEGGSHEVHHCGGEHVKIDPNADYSICHCSHGLHCIDKKVAVGHATGKKLEPIEVKVEFTDVCADCAGWHLESGRVISEDKS